MKRGPGRWRAAAAGVVSGLLFALAFPPFDLVVLLPLALVPWLVALLREERPARALVSGALFGLAYWCASIPWIIYVVTHYGGQSGPMGVVSLAILALILAEWPAAVAWATVAWAPAGSLGRLAVFPLLWVASEHARSFAYKGFPWNLTGHALFRQPLWLQTASVWGVYGVGALVVAVSALLAAGIATRRVRPLALAAVLVLAAGVFGAVRLAAPAPSGPELTVALLQPNVTEEMRATPQGAAEAYAILLAQAREAAARRPALIVFPESALPLYWDHSPTLRRDLAEIVREGPAILFGDVQEDADGRYYNVARLLTRDGVAGAAYRKVHLVPFGEYVPLPRLFFFVRQISNDIGEFSAAAEPTIIRSGPLALGLGICYEIIYPGLSRRETAQRSEPARDDLERLLVRPRRRPGTALRRRRAAHGRKRAVPDPRRDHGHFGLRGCARPDPDGVARERADDPLRRGPAARRTGRSGPAGDTGSRGSPTSRAPPC